MKCPSVLVAILATLSCHLSVTEAVAKDKSARAEVEPGKEYVYKSSGSKPQTLEVYFPKDWKPAENKVPGIILFHGGGWSGGSLDQFQYACRYFASRGLVAATANYQLASRPAVANADSAESPKRRCITDAKSAIRWMKQHAAELGVDPARIITGGGSAGGHVSVLATLTPGLDDPADPASVDTSVVAYLLFNPAFDGKDSTDKEIDVLQHLKAEMAPSILFFGTNDSWKKGADAMRAKLKTLGHNGGELWIAEGQHHSFFNGPPWQDLTIAEADRFLVRLGMLKGEPTLAAPASGEKIEHAP